MTALKELQCVPCKGDAPLLSEAEILHLLPQIPEWQLVETDGISKLRRIFRFKDFAAALDFTIRVGAIAETEDHHPAILTEWGRVTVTWWTHKIRDLHQNDFIMAARTDALYTP